MKTHVIRVDAEVYKALQERRRFYKHKTINQTLREALVEPMKLKNKCR